MVEIQTELTCCYLPDATLTFVNDACRRHFGRGREAALRAVVAARNGMAHLDAVRQAQGLPPLPFGAVLHLGEICGAISARSTGWTSPNFLLEEDRIVEVGDPLVVMYNDDPGNLTLVLTHQQNDDPDMGVTFVGRPLGKALIGLAEGEVVGLPAGDGVREATISELRRLHSQPGSF